MSGGLRVGVGAALLLAGSAVAQPAPPLPALVKSSCAACHSFEQGGPHGQGPNLYGVVGTKAGSARGYVYSSAFQAALGGKTWTPELLDAWLTDTQQVAPDTLMTFFLDDAQARRQIVDYLAAGAAAR